MKKILYISIFAAALSSADAENRFAEAAGTAFFAVDTTLPACTAAVPYSARAGEPGFSVRAGEIVARMSAAVKALGSYAAEFSVTAGEYVAQGDYIVAGDGYYLSLGDVEVFSDGKVRREVNRAMREITVDAVDASSRNILDNPAHGFDFLQDEFRAELLSESDRANVVRLTPVGGAADGVIVVTVGAIDCLPLKLSYRFGSDTVEIDIRHIASASKPLPSFDLSAFKGFEIIDFR